jgi:hypothetical protein
MANEDPFSIDSAPAPSDADAGRRKKLQLYGLQGLARSGGADQTSEELQDQPLYGGALSKSTQIPQDIGEPSELATERVQRAPISQEASPLLGPEDRLGNAVSEFERGEEGSYGPLSNSDRQSSLRDLFGPSASAAGTAAQASAGSADDGVAAGLSTAKTAVGAAKAVDSASGGKATNALRDLFTAGSAGASFPKGLSLTGGAEAAGPQFGEGLSLTGPDAASTEIPSGDFTLGESGVSGGAVLGAGASALGLISLLYSMYQKRGGDMSPGDFIGTIQSSGGLASSLGALGGGGAAVTPMIAGAGSSALGSGAGAAAGLSAAGAGLSGIGATMGIGMNLGNMINGFMSGDDRALGPAVGTAAGMGLGAGAGAIVGTVVFPVVGTVLGALIGAGIGGAAGGALGGLFGQNLPHYYAVREHAGGVAGDAATKYADAVIQAGNTGDILQVQRALGQGFADGRVRVDLNLPKDVAAALGVPTNVKMSQLNPEQFLTLLKAYSEREGFNANWFVGSGDVPYLSGDEHGGASQVAGQVANIARGTFDVMTQFYANELAQTPSVAPINVEQIGDYRIAPEIQYQAYNQHTGEPGAGPPTWDPASYDTIRSAAQGGTLSDLFLGGGTPMGTPAGRAAELLDYQRRNWWMFPGMFPDLEGQRVYGESTSGGSGNGAGEY